MRANNHTPVIDTGRHNFLKLLTSYITHSNLSN